MVYDSGCKISLFQAINAYLFRSLYCQIVRFMLIDTISLELFTHTDQWKENGGVALSDGFFMLHNFSFANRDFLLSSQPYRLKEGRVVLVRRGSAHYTFNLVDYHFRAGDLVVFLADTLIEKQGHSDDFEVDAFSFDFDAPWLPDIPEGFITVHLDERSQSIADRHIELAWQLVHEPGEMPVENLKLIISSLLLFVCRQAGQHTVSRQASHQEEMLHRFLELVSQHASRQRSIPFYADLLCLAPHYLSTLVKQASGRTVMQWVNETAVKEAKVWLAYSDDTIAQIADHMQFPSAASLTKFFKRETGLTPSDYRTESQKR